MSLSPDRVDAAANTGKAVSELFSRIGEQMRTPLRQPVTLTGIDKFKSDYRFARSLGMMTNPWRIKATITGDSNWYGDESLDDLEYAANEKLEDRSLTMLARLDLEAALSAIGDIRQNREAAEERSASLIRDNNAGRRG